MTDGEPGIATQFPTTRWTLIRTAQSNPADLEELLRRYWSPVYAFFLRSGHQPADAEDLAQAFHHEVLIERRLIERADSSIGSFRSYLCTALRNFDIDHHRKTSGGRLRLLPDDPSVLTRLATSEADDPLDAANRQFAAATFTIARDRAEADCRASGLERHWRAFEARLLHPLVFGSGIVPISMLTETLPARDRQEVYDLVQTAKRRFDRALRSAIEDTVESVADVDAELSELLRCLGRP